MQDDIFNMYVVTHKMFNCPSVDGKSLVALSRFGLLKEGVGRRAGQVITVLLGPLQPNTVLDTEAQS